MAKKYEVAFKKFQKDEDLQIRKLKNVLDEFPHM